MLEQGIMRLQAQLLRGLVMKLRLIGSTRSWRCWLWYQPFRKGSQKPKYEATPVKQNYWTSKKKDDVLTLDFIGILPWRKFRNCFPAIPSEFSRGSRVNCSRASRSDRVENP